MATMTKKTVDELIRHNGLIGELAPDNSPAVRIVEYTNAWGALAYGVTFKGERDPYRYERESQYVINPKVIWERS